MNWLEVNHPSEKPLDFPGNKSQCYSHVNFLVSLVLFCFTYPHKKNKEHIYVYIEGEKKTSLCGATTQHSEIPPRKALERH